MTAVLLVISAMGVILSRLLASKTPNSSVKALRVPEPSSREMTTMLLPAAAEASCPESVLPLAKTAAAVKTINARLISFFMLHSLCTGFSNSAAQRRGFSAKQTLLE
jgi:hypothetical protein